MATYQYVVLGLTFGCAFPIILIYIKDRFFQKSTRNTDQPSEMQEAKPARRGEVRHQMGAAPLAWRIGKKWDD